ncbi:MAG: flagellar motor switch protein FliG [Spirochaetia bacterium]|jgi:flagellar motor switch protein FliG|nr:flagellar motor switch protein FliG [Spirochaetia bacterium]
MKHIDEMTGTERAAALLVALGPERASDILKHLDEKSIETITVEIAKIGRLDPEEKDDLIGDFILSIKRNSGSLEAGKESAREILEKAFGADKSSQILKKLSAKDFEKEFDFFKDADPEILFMLIQKESPQMTAVILSYIPPAVSAAVLKLFPAKTTKEIAVRMAHLDSVAQEAVLDLVGRLKDKYEQYVENVKKGFGTEGIASLVEIMNYMTDDDEKKLMKNLDGALPDISKNIREKIISFETVNNLTNNDMRILIDEVNNDQLIAAALKGSDDDIRFKFLRNMSRNRATDLLENMDKMGAIRKADAEDSRKEIVRVIRFLYESGVIHIQKPGEIYVE